MKVGFIGNFGIGTVGEFADEVHMAREIESLGHEVYRIARDEWREYVIENAPQNKYKIPENIKLDIIICCKWHHFYDGSFIKAAREKYSCPVFYMVWDYMDNGGFPDWHLEMAKAADLYLSGEMGRSSEYKQMGIKFYYLQFDGCDKDIPRLALNPSRIYDVVFTGNYNQMGDREKILTEINKVYPIDIFAYNYEEWERRGFRAHPAVFGEEYNKIMREAKVVLGISGEAHCWGYWSNRVGKVIRGRGNLLQQYAPGMEQLVGDQAEYFSTIEEAIEKVGRFVNDPEYCAKQYFKTDNDPEAFTSKRKMWQLMVVAERFLKENNGKDWIL